MFPTNHWPSFNDLKHDINQLTFRVNNIVGDQFIKAKTMMFHAVASFISYCYG